MKWPKLRELKEAFTALIKGPYTSKFPVGPYTPHANFRGQPKFNKEKCIGCLACEQVCPVQAIDHKDIINEEGIPCRIITHYTDTCIFCGQCEAACIADNEGIKQTTDWELSFFDRKKESFEIIEKELQLCEICASPIACKEHLQWIINKLGELTFSNPTLYLSRLKDIGIIDDNIVSALKDKGRSDRGKILCARCRRATTN